MLDIREITKSKNIIPPSSKGNKSPATKEIYSELPLMTSAIKKQGSETEMNRMCKGPEAEIHWLV